MMKKKPLPLKTDTSPVRRTSGSGVRAHKQHGGGGSGRSGSRKVVRWLPRVHVFLEACIARDVAIISAGPAWHCGSTHES